MNLNDSLQIQRLTVTWHILRQKFTDSAFNFEAKLRPTLKSMNECTNPQAPNTTIPHLLPCVLLQQRTLEDIVGQCFLCRKQLQILFKPVNTNLLITYFLFIFLNYR